MIVEVAAKDAVVQPELWVEPTRTPNSGKSAVNFDFKVSIRLKTTWNDNSVRLEFWAGGLPHRFALRFQSDLEDDRGNVLENLRDAANAANEKLMDFYAATDGFRAWGNIIMGDWISNSTDFLDALLRARCTASFALDQAKATKSRGEAEKLEIVYSFLICYTVCKVDAASTVYSM